MKKVNWKKIAEEDREIKLDYEYKEHEININTIKSFELLENRRLLRINHAKQIKRALLSGINFDAPMIINEIKNKKRIIDGQHRYMAIKEILDMFPKFKIKCLLIVYKNLPQEKEEEIFSRYNKGMKQSSDDYVQMYADRIKLIKMLKDVEIPVTIYRQVDKFHFKPLVEAYIHSKKKGITQMTKEDFIEKCINLKEEDAKIIKDFIKGFNKYVVPRGNSDYFRTTPIASLFYTWLNRRISEKEYWEKIQNRVLNHDKFLMFCRLGGHSATNLCIETIVALIERSQQNYEEMLEVESER